MQIFIRVAGGVGVCCYFSCVFLYTHVLEPADCNLRMVYM